MSDKESRLRVTQQRGQQAKELLDNELLTESFSFIEEKITNEWKEGDVRDRDLMERCKHRHDSLRLFKAYLQEVLVKGETAKQELLDLEKTSSIKRKFRR